MKETSLKTKGSVGIAQLIGWGLAIAVPTVMGVVTYTSNEISKVADAQTASLQRISVVETKSDQYERDITNINGKLDDILKRLK